MRLLALAVLTAASSITLNAQTKTQPEYLKFQWQSNPKLHAIDAKYADEAAAYVADEKLIEYAVEKDGFYTYKTVHRIIHLNNDKGIEYFNKIYLPFDEGLKMMNVKARTVLPNGTVMELDENNIKDLKEEDRTYKIFALEGLTKGCEVEYYYTVKTYPSFFGREMISSSIPVLKSRFELVSPDHLKFEAKNYNGLPSCKDSVYNDKRHVWLDAEKLDAEEEEKYAMYTANLKRVEYKLCYNQARNSTERMFTWNELAKKAYEIYTRVSEKEVKRIKELAAEAGASEVRSEKENIVLLENYLKKNFIVRDDISEDDAEDLVKVIKNKVASEKAFCKLFSVALSTVYVNFQIVLCGNRSTFVLDRGMENWNNAANLLFFFPASKKFLAPTEAEYRYPWIPPTWAGTNGLFCVVTSLGSFRTALAEFKPIPLEDFQYSFQNMDIKATFDKDGDALEMDVKHSYGGYSAPNYRVPFAFAPVDEQNKLLKELIKSGTNSENMISHSFENKELEQADPYKPFVINAKVKSPAMVERAGNKIIVKVGEFIGDQVQMYDPKERKFNIDLEYPHSLVRTIALTIPDGYEVKNLADLNFNEVYKDNDNVTLCFVCTYEQTGNILKIVIKEEYKNYFYPVQQYAPFKKVINAAADFNKVVLVMDKKA